MFDGVEPGPHFADPEIGVGVEAGGEFFPLMQHVAFDLVVDFIPLEPVLRLDDVATGASFDGVEVDEGFVADHPSEC